MFTVFDADVAQEQFDRREDQLKNVIEKLS